MAEQEKKLTPEEKLLKVIQGGGKEAPKAVPGEPPKASQPPQSQPRVPPRLVPPSPKTIAPALAATPASQASAPAPAPASGSSKSKRAATKVGAEAGAAQPSKAPALPALASYRLPALTTLNRFLAIAAALAVAVSGWELWASCMARPVVPGGLGADEGLREAAPVASASGEPCAAARDAFAAKPLFAVVSEGGIVTMVTNVPPSEAQQYAKNLDLIGVSTGRDGQPEEAIVVDRSTKKNYFVKVGEAIVIGQMKLELVTVAIDGAVFRTGKGEIRVQ